MIHTKLKLDQNIFFKKEKLPYKIMAMSERFVIVSRKLNRREDAELLHHKVRMSAYLSFTEAFNANKENPVYSIIDLQYNVRSSCNLIFDFTDYFDKEDCQKCIKMLESGEIELSKRNMKKLEINWDQTK